MAIERAWARVTGSAGASAAIVAGRRMSALSRSGTGDYTLTVSEDFVANGTNYGVRASCLDGGATPNDHIDAVAVNDTQIHVRTTQGGGAADFDFCVEAVQASS